MNSKNQDTGLQITETKETETDFTQVLIGEEYRILVGKPLGKWKAGKTKKVIGK